MVLYDLFKVSKRLFDYFFILVLLFCCCEVILVRGGYPHFQLVNCAHAQERVVDMMWRMALARSLARLADSCKSFFDFRLLSAFDTFWRAINKRNGDLCY